jgi:uncharacterized membrane protein (UPF0127 family)
MMDGFTNKHEITHFYGCDSGQTELVLANNVNDPKSQGLCLRKHLQETMVFPNKSCAMVNMFHSTEASTHHPGLVGAFEDTSALVQLCHKIPRSHGILFISPERNSLFFHHRETPLSKVSPLNILPWI